MPSRFSVGSDTSIGCSLRSRPRVESLRDSRFGSSILRPASGVWWASSTAPGRIDPPMEGRWVDGRGVFYGDDVIAGLDVRLRFVWTRQGEASAKWEQSFSYDAGETWKHNWTMDFTRRE
jgi:hypothetical protein